MISEYQSFMKMTLDQFEFLLLNVYPMIKRADTNMRGAIPMKIKLQLILSF